MAELEIHHEVEHHDDLGRKVGVLASLVAVLLAVVTILSHRAHTEAVLLKADTNDKWSYYQSKRIKFHNLELGEDIMRALPVKTPEAEKSLERYAEEKKKYTAESKKAEEEARETGKESAHVETRALRFDFGEGLLEIGLVLTSLYFIAKKKLFPVLGLTAAVAGTLIAASGLFL